MESGYIQHEGSSHVVPFVLDFSYFDSLDIDSNQLLYFNNSTGVNCFYYDLNVQLKRSIIWNACNDELWIGSTLNNFSLSENIFITGIYNRIHLYDYFVTFCSTFWSTLRINRYKRTWTSSLMEYLGASL